MKPNAQTIINGTHKHCSKCGELKTLDRFSKWKKGKTGLCSRCLDCSRDACIRYTWARFYGISAEDYVALSNAQGNRCAICGGLDADRRLAVDHCHTTKVVRGLLCGNCNRGIGNFRDRIDLLKNAIRYLGRHAKKEASAA